MYNVIPPDNLQTLQPVMETTTHSASVALSATGYVDAHKRMLQNRPSQTGHLVLYTVLNIII